MNSAFVSKPYCFVTQNISYINEFPTKSHLLNFIELTQIRLPKGTNYNIKKENSILVIKNSSQELSRRSVELIA